MTDALPEGYIALNKDATTFAVDSTTLARNGEVHSNRKLFGTIDRILGENDFSSLDSFVELRIKGDPRLQPLELQAKQFGSLYGDSKSPQYIADARTREKKIVDLLTPLVYEAYGPYSEEIRTKKKYWNTEEENARGFFLSRTSQLKDMEYGSLVCVPEAAVWSNTLEHAGIHNHLVCSYVNETTNGVLKSKPGAHAYVMTLQGNAIVEGSGMGQGVSIYSPIVNDVKVADIVYRGKAAITNTGVIYGGHGGDGGNAHIDLAAIHAQVVNAQQISLNTYRQGVAQKAAAAAKIEQDKMALAQKNAVDKKLTEMMDAQDRNIMVPHLSNPLPTPKPAPAVAKPAPAPTNNTPSPSVPDDGENKNFGWIAPVAGIAGALLASIISGGLSIGTLLIGVVVAIFTGLATNALGKHDPAADNVAASHTPKNTKPKNTETTHDPEAMKRAREQARSGYKPAGSTTLSPAPFVSTGQKPLHRGGPN